MAALSAELELLNQQHTLQADELQATVDAAQKAKDEHVLSLEETQQLGKQKLGRQKQAYESFASSQELAKDSVGSNPACLLD